MIKFVEGNFFDFEADIMINTVNCVGVMGAGAALQFKNKFPSMFKDYSLACSRNEVKIGKPHVWEGDYMFKPLTIINFPTKNHWKKPSKYEYIEEGLEWLENYLNSLDNLTITLPALGCGHGGLDWNIVKGLITKYLKNIKSTILVFEPNSSTKTHISKELNELLARNEINKIQPNDKLYPSRIKGQSSKEIFYKGNVDLLSKKNISLIVTSKPEEREKSALKLFINELPNNDFVFLLGFGNSYEIDIVKYILEKGFKTVLIVPYGILKLKVRKDLNDIWNLNNVLVTSISKPNESWKSYESINALKFRLKISNLLLINSISYDRLEKFENEFKSSDNDKYYLNYWNSYIDFFTRINANKIGLNSKTKKPNTEKLLKSLKR